MRKELHKVMNTIISVLLFALIFCLIVSVHEGGHLVAAKLLDIHVKEYMVGLGHAIFKKKIGETTYKFGCIPLGGACVFDDVVIDEHGNTSVIEDERSFSVAPTKKKIPILLAGPFANFILAYVVSIMLVSVTPWNFPIITGFAENSAAKSAGLQEGDYIQKINGKTVNSQSDVSLLLAENNGNGASIIYTRNREVHEAYVVPRLNDEGRSVVGVYIGKEAQISGIQVFKYAAYNVESSIRTTYIAFKMLIKGQGDNVKIQGPIGMIQNVEQVYTQSVKSGIGNMIISMLNLTMTLSISLGVFNLLPIPGLDGGRVAMSLFNVLKGSPVSKEKELKLTLIGFSVIAFLLIATFISDVANIIA